MSRLSHIVRKKKEEKSEIADLNAHSTQTKPFPNYVRRKSITSKTAPLPSNLIDSVSTNLS